jgi:hypothetical protein
MSGSIGDLMVGTEHAGRAPEGAGRAEVRGEAGADGYVSV